MRGAEGGTCKSGPAYHTQLFQELLPEDYQKRLELRLGAQIKITQQRNVAHLILQNH